jgi:hypothetical protein
VAITTDLEVIVMGEREERSERVNEEVDPTSDDPELTEVADIAAEGQIIGKLDDVADHAARGFTGDSAGRGVEGDLARPPATRESGRGETMALDADAERRLGLGDELVVRLPEDGAAEGWTYEVDGAGRVLEVEERAEMVVRQGAGQQRVPAVGDRFQFVLHAAAPGRATVRFEAPGRALRLRVEVG